MRICKEGKSFNTCEKAKRNKLGCKRCRSSEEREIPYSIPPPLPRYLGRQTR